MIDSHAHLYFDAFDPDRQLVFDRASAAGVEHFVVVGVDLATSTAARELSRQRRDVSASAGIHPNDVGLCDADEWSRLEELVSGGGFSAVGETGLDYYWDKTPKDVQAEWFRRHLTLARRMDLPVIIHCRDAWPALLDLLEAESAPSFGVMHCFSGTRDDMRRALRLGYDISFAGPLTYPKSVELREVCRDVPLENIHIETDCPFLPPQGLRGQRNEPSYLTRVVNEIARIKGLDPLVVDQQSTANSSRLFRIDLRS